MEVVITPMNRLITTSPDTQMNSQQASKRARDAPRMAEDEPKRVPRQPRRSDIGHQKHSRSSYMVPKQLRRNHMRP